MFASRSHLWIRSLGLALLLGAAACADAPTVPPSVQRLAGDELWIAVTPPPDLPRLDSWLRYVPASTDEGRTARLRIHEMQRAATAARRDGRFDEAASLHRDAERLAVLSMGRGPDPLALRRALSALAFWEDRVTAQVDVAHAPDLHLALGRVAASRVAAARFLAVGDTTGAVLAIVEAAELVRDHAPAAVALRILSRVRERLDPDLLEPAAYERATHLLENASQELVSGNSSRALQRALYALQIVSGQELRTVDSEPEPPCTGSTC